MTIDRFQALSLKTQKELAIVEGIPLVHKKTRDYDAVLYTVDDFYVELYYPPQSDTVVWVSSFNDMEELDFYLDEIEVSAVCYS